MQLKRVVVTGLGALTPIGNNIEEYWEGLKNGKSGSAPVTYYNTETYKGDDRRLQIQSQNDSSRIMLAYRVSLRS